MLIHKHEGHLGITFRLQPTQCFISDHIGGVARVWQGDGFAVISSSDHGGIVIGSLSHQNFVVVETLWRGGQVPLSNHRRLITCSLQHFWKGPLVPIEDIAIPKKSIGMAIQTGLDDSPARTTNGISDVTTGKLHAFVGQTVHIGCGHSGGIVGTQSLFAVVVREDEQYVGSFLSEQKDVDA